LASFFSGIQSYFKGEFGGRYIAVLLAEVCAVDPAPFRRFFREEFNNQKYSSGLLTLEPEFPFGTPGEPRRADLVAVLDGKPATLIELKFRDKLMPEVGRKRAQLSEYLRFCRRKKLNFMLLSKEPPSYAELAEISAYRQRRVNFSRLAVHLGQSSNPASQLLYKYFREKGLVVETLNQDILYRLFHRLLKPWGHAGRINSRDTLSEGPVQFQALLSNMRLIATDLGPRFKLADVATARSATIDFHITANVSADSLRSCLKTKGTADGIEVPDEARRGGLVYVYATHSMGGMSKWLYLEYGIGFELQPGKNRSLSPFLYATIDGQGFKSQGVELYAEQGIRFSAFTKPEYKGEIEHEILILVRKVARKASKLKTLSRQGRTALLRI
jgi:hypothetical protein